MHNDPNEISEGEHLSDSLEGFDDDTFVPHHNVHRLTTSSAPRLPVTNTQQYESNKAAKVGTEIKCPTCNKAFIKVSYQQAFCKGDGKRASKCKDRYHNAQPHRIQRTLNWPAR